MRILIEHGLAVTVLLSWALLNIFAGFLGLALGDYFVARRNGVPTRFWQYFCKHVKKFLHEYAMGDISPMAGTLIFAHFGAIFLFLVLIGPRNPKPWIEPDNKLK